MLKPQDIVLLIKLLANEKHLDWPQQRLATHLCLSISAIKQSIVRLSKSGLLFTNINQMRYRLVLPACEELLIYGIKYFLPVQLGDYTVGIATSYAAPIFEKRIILGQDPITVWPYAEGNKRGFALQPLYHCIPESITHYPDQRFYDLLTLVDAIRQGSARERNIAIKLIKEELSHGETE